MAGALGRLQKAQEPPAVSLASTGTQHGLLRQRYRLSLLHPQNPEAHSSRPETQLMPKEC